MASDAKNNVKYDESLVDLKPVTPNDTTALPDGVTRALYVGVSGDVEVITLAGTTTVIKNAPVGLFPIRVTHVKAANTTAQEIQAGY